MLAKVFRSDLGAFGTSVRERLLALCVMFIFSAQRWRPDPEKGPARPVLTAGGAGCTVLAALAALIGRSAINPYAGGTMRTLIGLVVTIALMSGCSSYTVAKYGVTPDSVTALRTVGGQKVNVGAFRATKAAQTEIGCRGVGPVKAPDGSTFEDYIRKAFIDEFKVANILADPAPVTLTGNLDKLDFSSTSGKWNIDLTLTSSNGRTLTISEVYDYETSFIGEKACALTAQAFTPAIQSMIGKTFRRPEFAELLK